MNRWERAWNKSELPSRTQKDIFLQTYEVGTKGYMAIIENMINIKEFIPVIFLRRRNDRFEVIDRFETIHKIYPAHFYELKSTDEFLTRLEKEKEE